MRRRRRGGKEIEAAGLDAVDGGFSGDVMPGRGDGPPFSSSDNQPPGRDTSGAGSSRQNFNKGTPTVFAALREEMQALRADLGESKRENDELKTELSRLTGKVQAGAQQHTAEQTQLMQQHARIKQRFEGGGSGYGQGQGGVPGRPPADSPASWHSSPDAARKSTAPAPRHRSVPPDPDHHSVYSGGASGSGSGGGGGGGYSGVGSAPSTGGGGNAGEGYAASAARINSVPAAAATSPFAPFTPFSTSDVEEVARGINVLGNSSAGLPPRPTPQSSHHNHRFDGSPGAGAGATDGNGDRATAAAARAAQVVAPPPHRIPAPVEPLWPQPFGPPKNSTGRTPFIPHFDPSPVGP